jgi:hypothetical protein
MHERRISGLAEAEIAALEADGIRLRPHEIVNLNALAWQVESPEIRRQLSRGLPVFIGSAVLWPMTMHAADWYRRRGCKMTGHALQLQALAYAMAYGRTGLGAAMEGPGAARIVAQWGNRLRCTIWELEVAVSQIIEQDEQPDEVPARHGEKYMSPGELSAYMAATAGGSPRTWERRVSIGYVFSMLATLAAQHRADNERAHDPQFIRANRALGYYTEMIRARHRKEQAA